MKQVGCVVITTNKMKTAIMVTRKSNLKLLGLPGGKLEPEETPIDGAIREVFEETGISLIVGEHIHEHPIYVDCQDGMEVHTFLAVVPESVTCSQKEYRVKTVTIPISFIADPSITEFAEYNKQVLNVINILRGDVS